MSEFKNLVHLKCFSNHITYIIGLSDKLERLACVSNNIDNLSNLPSGLKYLSCSEKFKEQIDKRKFTNLSIFFIDDIICSKAIVLGKSITRKRSLNDDENKNDIIGEFDSAFLSCAKRIKTTETEKTEET